MPAIPTISPDPTLRLTPASAPAPLPAQRSRTLSRAADVVALAAPFVAGLVYAAVRRPAVAVSSSPISA